MHYAANAILIREMHTRRYEARLFLWKQQRCSTRRYLTHPVTRSHSAHMLPRMTTIKKKWWWSDTSSTSNTSPLTQLAKSFLLFHYYVTGERYWKRAPCFATLNFFDIGRLSLFKSAFKSYPKVVNHYRRSFWCSQKIKIISILSLMLSFYQDCSLLLFLLWAVFIFCTPLCWAHLSNKCGFAHYYLSYM